MKNELARAFPNGLDVRACTVGTSLRPGAYVIRCPVCKKPGEYAPSGDDPFTLIHTFEVAGDDFKSDRCCALYGEQYEVARRDALLAARGLLVEQRRRERR